MSLELNPITREFFTVNYSQVLSPKSEYIAVSNNFGEVYAISIKSEAEEKEKSKNFQKLLFDDNVYSLATVNKSNLLLCGSENGQLYGYSWSDLLKIDSEFREEKFSANINSREINSICLINDDIQFVTGYGDGNLSLFDLHKPDKALLNLTGHDDQINQVIAYDRNQFVSCSSDGSICLFDSLVGSNPVKKIDVIKEKSVLRSGHCKSILSVARHDKFILCGGGINLSQFDMSNGSLLQVFTGPKHNNSFYINCIEVSLDKIGIGTSTGSVFAYSHAGHFINGIPVNHGSVLNLNTIVDQQFKHTRTIASGVGSKISMLINHGYVSYTLNSDTFE